LLVILKFWKVGTSVCINEQNKMIDVKRMLKSIKEKYM